MNGSGSDAERSPLPTLQNFKFRPGILFGIIILTALLAFEIFNYSTTEFALQDLLGGLRFAGIRWSTVLSIAFCGIDFAGIARLFTPQQNSEEPKEVWYLFGAWLLAATMNAILTWWGVSMAINNHAVASSKTVVDQTTLTKIVPVFVAIMVWVIRILIIGSLSYAGDRIFAYNPKQKSTFTPARRPAASQPQYDYTPASQAVAPASLASRPAPSRPATNPRPVQRSPIPAPPEPMMNRPEPTYHSLSARSAPSRPSSPMGDSGELRHH